MNGPAPELAVNTLAWHGYSFEVAFAEIAEIGARCVEPALISGYYPEIDDRWFSPENARSMASAIRANGLRVLAVGAHMDAGLEGAEEGLRRRIEFAAALGARYLHTNTTSRSREQALLDHLEAVIPAAEQARVVLCLENPGDGMDSLLADGRSGAALVARIGSPQVRLNYDFSNTYSYSRGAVHPERDCLEALSAAAHLHLKEIAPAGSGWRFVAIGAGVLDYDAILRSVAAMPVAPPLAIELPLRHHRGADWRIALDPAAPPVPLTEIRSVMRASLAYVAARLGASLPAPHGAMT